MKPLNKRAAHPSHHGTTPSWTVWRACAGWILLTLFFIQGCSTAPSSTPSSSPAADLSHWSLQGKLGVRNGKDSGSANIRWQQEGDNYRIHLSGPFGAGGARLTGNSRQVTFEQSGKPTQTAASANQLLLNNLGWPVPVQELFYWVRGLPAPGVPSENAQRNAQKQLTELSQAGWRLSFSNYQQLGAATLPGRIKAEHIVGGNVKVTLVIKSWLL